MGGCTKFVSALLKFFELSEIGSSFNGWVGGDKFGVGLFVLNPTSLGCLGQKTIPLFPFYFFIELAYTWPITVLSCIGLPKTKTPYVNVEIK